MEADARTKILIVEDEGVVALDIEQSLRRAGYDVVGMAAHGEEAVDLAFQARPDLVLMDIQLRGEMDGITAAREIQDNVGIPVVYLTAHTDDVTLGRATLTQPFGYLAKPYDERELEIAIQVALQRHQSERAVRAAEERARSILQTARDAIIITESDGGITEWNAAAEAMFGISVADAVGKPVQQVLPAIGVELQHLWGSDEATNQHDVDRAVEVATRGRDGRELTVELSLSAWHDDGSLRRTAIVRDISERARVRAILQRETEQQRNDLEVLAHELAQRNRDLAAALEAAGVARREAEKAAELKTHLLNLASHEIRTPLAALQLQLELLRLELTEPSPKTARGLERINAAAKRLEGLVEGLLQHARVESGRINLDLSEIGVRQLAEGVLEQLRPAAERKGLELRLVNHPPLGRLWTDERILRIILDNLIGNAIKFTGRGTVTLTLTEEGGMHRFTVTDTGPGIPREQQPRVFEPFAQGVPLRSKHEQGFGLGLALVRALTEALGGAVDLESELGRGSTFTVQIPDRKPAAEQPRRPA